MNKVKNIAISCLFGALLLPFFVGFAQAQNLSGQLCPGEMERRMGYEEYQYLLLYDISSLYHSLFMISQLEKTENAGLNTESISERFTDQSVFALANIISSSANYVKNCVDPGTHYNSVYRNETFILRFWSVTERPDFPSSQLVEKLFRDNARCISFFSHGMMDVNRNCKFYKLGKTITKRLKMWEKHGDFGNDPIALAARLLLNKKGTWSSRGLNPIQQFKISPQGEKLFADKSFGTMGRVRSTRAIDELQKLSEYYLPVSTK